MRRGALAAALLSSIAAAPHVARAETRVDAEFLAMVTTPSRAPGAFTDRRGQLPLVVKLPRGAEARALGFLPMGPGFGSVRVAPQDLLEFQAAHPGLTYSVWPGLRPVLDRSVQWNRTAAYRAQLAAAGVTSVGSGKGVVVGIVDTGIDVAHADFRDAAGRTRVAWMIDFGHGPVGRHPELEARYGCSDPHQAPCAVLDARDIDEALAGRSTLYRPVDVVGHGTHVASIAAGNGGAERRFVGSAPESTLIVAGVSDGFGSSVADTDIAVGVQFVFERAEALGMPAAVNLSLGGDFGPHDGTTPIEQALASMVGSAHPGRALIVAAGNSGTLYQGEAADQVLGVHTQTRVTRGVPARLTVLPPGHGAEQPTDGVGYVWIAYGARDDIVVGLDGPRDLHVAGVRQGAKASATSSDGALTAAVYNGVVDSEAPLQGTPGAVLVWRGSWPAGSSFSLWFEGEGFVDAWVQSLPDGALFEMAMREGTINVPATHPDLIAVGCTVNLAQWRDAAGVAYDVASLPSLGPLGGVDSPCYFSSAGPSATGVAKPDLSAPGAMVAAAMSRDAAPSASHASPFDAPRAVCPRTAECLVVDPTHALLSGSSMAAPQVTGAVALLLERDAMLTQSEVLHLLQRGARRPGGIVRSDFQLGVGALDVVGAIEALETRSGSIAREPEARASWLSLSSSYLRTEPAYAMAGTVEVRAADGRAADGFAPERLTLEVGEGGMVQQPLARVAPGLWRFKLISRPDAGSQTVPVAVKLDGVVIGLSGSSLYGRRELAVGADRWIAFGSAHAFGGCAFSSSGAPAQGARPIAALMLVAGAASVARFWSRSPLRLSSRRRRS